MSHFPPPSIGIPHDNTYTTDTECHIWLYVTACGGLRALVSHNYTNGLINSIPPKFLDARVSSVHRRFTPATWQAPRIMLPQCDKLNRSARLNAESNAPALGSAIGNRCRNA